jgi:cardiolipin synthase (CMP-forming)
MRITTATKITLLRMFLIPFVAMGILYHRYGTVLIIFLISGLSDLFDGLIARKYGQKSRLGALLDPMADKLLLCTSFLLLTIPSTGLSVPIPIWLAIVVFGRDIIIVISAVAITMTTGFTKFDPTIYGKASTLVQILCVLGVLLVNHFRLSPSWIYWLFYLTLVLTLFSGLHYIYTFTKRYETESQLQNRKTLE